LSWSDLQALFADQSAGISATNISGTNLILYMRLVLMKIASFYDWSFAIRTVTITTGGTSPIDLKTKIPDLKRLITITATTGGTPYEFELVPSRDYQLTLSGDGDMMDPRNKSLYLQNGTEANLPSSVTVVYFSNYLAESSTGTRKVAPDTDTDTFVLPFEWEPILLDGLLMYQLRKQKKYAEVSEIQKLFASALTEMALKEPAKVDAALRSFKHYHELANW
jgi:hypothetical protein